MARIREKLRGLCILVVEDEHLVARVLDELIKLYGGTVAGPAASEDEALAILDRTAVDCAVLDVNLQSGPCFSLVEALMRRGIPVILATGCSASDIPGAFRHLPTLGKPTNLEELVERVADCRRTVPNRLYPTRSRISAGAGL